MDGGVGEVLAVGSLISSVAGAGLSAVAGKQQADYQAAVARNNATAASNMARYDVEAGAAKAQDEDTRSASQIGKIVAGEAASGLDVNSGSQARVVSSSSEIARLNTLRTADNSSLQATAAKNQSAGFQAEAGLDSMRGDNAVTSSLISGAASVGDKWLSFQQKGLLTVPGGGSSSSSGGIGMA